MKGDLVNIRYGATAVARAVAWSLVYVLGMVLVLLAGFFPALHLAGHSGLLSGKAAALVWATYGLAVLLGPWPIVRWLHRRFVTVGNTDE